MTPDDARRVLGLDRAAVWPEIRTRHRRLIRSVHPDVGGDVRRAAELNEALTVLRRETDDGAGVDDVGGISDVGSVDDVDRLLHLDVAPPDLLMRFAEAGHAVGEVVFVDPVGGMLEIVVGEGAATAQLAVSVGEIGPDGVPVAFTLEPLRPGGQSPRIGTIVDALVAAVRARR